MSFHFSDSFTYEVPRRGPDARSEPNKSTFAPFQDDSYCEQFSDEFGSYSSSLCSENSFPSNSDVPIFSNELYHEDTNNEIEKMLMSLGIEDGRGKNDENLESTGIGQHATGVLGNTATIAQLNQIMVAQAYLAAMNFPMVASPLQYQTQGGVTLLQMPFGGSQPNNMPLQGNMTANPVFVILPPIDPSVAVQPNLYPSSDHQLNGQNPPSQTCLSVNKSEEVAGNVRKLFKDQAGCRLLQQKLQEGDAEQVASMYEESLQSIRMMMTDPFGNYLFQKLLENGTTEQNTEILSEVKDSLVDAALTIHGTRSVQKVLEFCKQPNQVAMIQSAIQPRIVDLCLDANGSHVIQKAVQCFSVKDKNFIYTSVMTNCKKIACHKHGCCVLQRCLESASREQQRALIGTIIFHALELMQDPFGNYVVQYVLDHGKQTEAWAVAQKCIGSVARLSTQKFSSNVMEKCLEKANDQLLAAIILELSAPATLVNLLSDQFANYVFQKAITVAPVDIARCLVETIRPHMNILRGNSGGRKILAKISKRFPKIEGPSPAF